MPIPWLIAGALGLLGISAHRSAKETNERAERVAQEAQYMYSASKTALEGAQKNTEAALLALGYAKKDTLEGPMKQFLHAYERVKDIQIKESHGLSEIENFVFTKQDAIQVHKMTNIYHSALTSSATGAAAGAIVALAASGSLPLVTGVLSTAGSALILGEFGVAAGLAGSALSFGAAMTPLSAIAAPVLLFTGISSSLKADENLEKAETMHAEAAAAVEKMKTSQVLCKGIAERAKMFDELLKELNKMFSFCAERMDRVTSQKTKGTNRVDINDLTEEDLKLIAVTRALAGAVKAVIDTPILSEDGTLSAESQNIYKETKNALPEFRENVESIQSNIPGYKVWAEMREMANNVREMANNIADAVKSKKLASWMPIIAPLTIVATVYLRLVSVNKVPVSMLDIAVICIKYFGKISGSPWLPCVAILVISALCMYGMIKSIQSNSLDEVYVILVLMLTLVFVIAVFSSTVSCRFWLYAMVLFSVVMFGETTNK